MTIRRTVAGVLVFALSTAVFPQLIVAQSLGGHSAYDNRPEFEVRIQNVTTNQVVGTVPLDDAENFLVNGLTLPGNFLVVLWDKTRDRAVCSEGPYELNNAGPATMSKLDVEIDCGDAAAWLWLGALAGGIGLATAIATQSDSD